MEWISVKDRLPAERVPVLIAYKGYNTGETHNDGVASVDKNRTWRWWDGDCAKEAIVVEVTHWMPLPEPPKD